MLQVKILLTFLHLAWFSISFVSFSKSYNKFDFEIINRKNYFW